MNEKTEKNILKVLDSIGEMLQQKDSEIYLQKIRVEALEQQVAKGEEEIKNAAAALRQANEENRRLLDRLALKSVSDCDMEMEKGA